MSRRALRVLGCAIALVLVSSGVVPGLTGSSLAQEESPPITWRPPARVPSPENTSSWFPDLAVDAEGNVHVIWCETNHQGYSETGEPVPVTELERVFHSMWDGTRWGLANDVVSPHQNIIRNAIAADGHGTVHMVYGADPPYSLYYTQAPGDAASSAAAWTSPRLVNTRQLTYMSDLAVFQDTLHVVYDDLGSTIGGRCPRCADIFYRQSSDGGRTWSAPIDLMETDLGASRAQMEVDRNGVIHVTWDEGWDRLSGVGEPQQSVYVNSVDGGTTWSSPTLVRRPERTAQLSVGSDNKDGVMLVWRTTTSRYPGIYYMWSTDLGIRWSTPITIPNVVARGWTDPFDRYDLATDSAGNIHLVFGGHIITETQTGTGEAVDSGRHGLYHVIWNGSEWSLPSVIYEGDWYPAYPNIVIERGNWLHVTWFLRETLWEDRTPHEVWYTRGQLRTPAETPIPPSTRTPTPTPEPSATLSPTPTPLPTVGPGASGIPNGLFTDADDVLRLGLALSPVALLIGVAIGIRLGWFRRR